MVNVIKHEVRMWRKRGKHLNLFNEQKYSNFISVIIFEIIRKKFKNMIVYC